jgi:transposase-like protein
MVDNDTEVWSKRGGFTTSSWVEKLSDCMDMVVQNRSKLSGEVEVDETYIGGFSEGKAGRGSENKTPVAVAVELKGKKLGRVRMSVLKDASGDSLVPFIIDNVDKGSKIITDGWSGFSGIEPADYERVVCKQSDAVSEDEMLPHVHLIVSLLKRWLLGTHQRAVEPKHLQAYLDEYVFRFNRRTSSKRGLLFYRLLENAMLVPPTTYRQFADKSPEP